jgi:hypothetical protein
LAFNFPYPFACVGGFGADLRRLFFALSLNFIRGAALALGRLMVAWVWAGAL